MKSLAYVYAAACVAACALQPGWAANSVSGLVDLPSYNVGGGGPNQTLVDLTGNDFGGTFGSAYTAGGSIYANLLTGTITFNAYGDNASTGVDLQLIADFQLEGPPAGAVPVTFAFAVRATGNVNYIAQGFSIAEMTSTLRTQERVSLSIPHESRYVYQWSIDGRGPGAFEQWIHQPSGMVTIDGESRGGFDVLLTTTENLVVQSNGRSRFVDVSARLLGSAGGTLGSGSLNGMHTGQLAVILPAGYRVASGIEFLSLPPEVQPIPEPGTAALAALGWAVVALFAARRRLTQR
jgi:hypothetical protein